MRFRELMNLPYDRSTNKIDVRALRACMADKPDDVLNQLFVNHGRNEEFQDYYGDLDLDGIEWSAQILQASRLIQCTINDEFRPWYDQVAKRVERFDAEAWSSIDIRPDVREHWKANRTWICPPIMLGEDVLQKSKHLHLMEGHTRVGLLKGLTTHKILPYDSWHKAWIGALRPA